MTYKNNHNHSLKVKQYKQDQIKYSHNLNYYWLLIVSKLDKIHIKTISVWVNFSSISNLKSHFNSENKILIKT